MLVAVSRSLPNAHQAATNPNPQAHSGKSGSRERSLGLKGQRSTKKYQGRCLCVRRIAFGLDGGFSIWYRSRVTGGDFERNDISEDGFK